MRQAASLRTRRHTSRRRRAAKHAMVGTGSPAKRMRSNRTIWRMPLVKALDVIQRIVAADPDNLRARQQLAKSYSRLGQTTTNIGQSASALGYLRRRFSSRSPRANRLRLEPALALSRFADARKGQGQLGSTFSDAGRAAAIYKDDRRVSLPTAGRRATRADRADHR